jgi:hypothetical protein
VSELLNAVLEAISGQKTGTIPEGIENLECHFKRARFIKYFRFEAMLNRRQREMFKEIDFNVINHVISLIYEGDTERIYKKGRLLEKNAEVCKWNAMKWTLNNAATFMDGTISSSSSYSIKEFLDIPNLTPEQINEWNTHELAEEKFRAMNIIETEETVSEVIPLSFPIECDGVEPVVKASVLAESIRNYFHEIQLPDKMELFRYLRKIFDDLIEKTEEKIIEILETRDLMDDLRCKFGGMSFYTRIEFTQKMLFNKVDFEGINHIIGMMSANCLYLKTPTHYRRIEPDIAQEAAKQWVLLNIVDKNFLHVTRIIKD